MLVAADIPVHGDKHVLPLQRYIAFLPYAGCWLLLLLPTICNKTSGSHQKGHDTASEVARYVLQILQIFWAASWSAINCATDGKLLTGAGHSWLFIAGTLTAKQGPHAGSYSGVHIPEDTCVTYKWMNLVAIVSHAMSKQMAAAKRKCLSGSSQM